MFDAKTWVQRVVHEAVTIHGSDIAAIEAHVAERKAALISADREAVDQQLRAIGFYEPDKPYDVS